MPAAATAAAGTTRITRVRMQPDEAIAFLLEGRLLDPRDLVQGEVRVEDRSARHRGFAVHCTTRSGIFLKQALSGDVLGTLATEAAFYQQVGGAGRLSALAPFVPRLLGYDRGRQLLALELLDASNARAGAGGAHALADIGSELGTMLALCHAAGTSDDADTRSAFAEMLPWAFHVAQPSPAIFRDVCPLQLELIRLVQRHRDVVDRFREMRRAWRCRAFIHGDLRWTNVLLDQGGGIRLVDWEAAGLGDPAWDLACAFEGWLSRGLETIPLAPDDGPAEAAARFAGSLPALQVQMSGLWRSYARRAVWDEEDAGARRDRATAYTGARLLQSAYEWAAGRDKLTPFILLTVQLAVSLLRQPAEGRAALLGVDTG